MGIKKVMDTKKRIASDRLTPSAIRILVVEVPRDSSTCVTTGLISAYGDSCEDASCACASPSYDACASYRLAYLIKDY